MAMAGGREIRLGGANLGAEGHRQGRWPGKRAENNGYAKPGLRPLSSWSNQVLDTNPIWA